MESDKDTRFAAACKMHTLGKDHAERTAVLHGYAEAFAASRLGRSMVAWRDDTLAVANAIEAGTAPAAARDVLAEGDYQRLGLIGMSFGGATAATTCKLLPTCRVAVNLDGENFDPELFNRSIERPMLLIMSDWARYPLFPGQSPDPAFHPVDYAYEPWARAGLDPDIQRVRLDDIGHMGFTDLIGLMSGPKRDERVGSIPGAQAFRAIGDISLAFLNRYLAGGDPAAIDRAIAANPKLHRHDPAEVRNWSLQNR
jgi:predicted dienelactone hydrolase